MLVVIVGYEQKTAVAYVHTESEIACGCINR